MADIGRSSFIPKETDGFTPGKVRRKRTFHVFGFISATMLIGSLVLGIGVYVLQSAAERELADAKQKLSEQKDLFKPEYISEVREFNRRIQAGEILLKNHIAPLKVFAELERATKQRVQFTSFGLEQTDASQILLSLKGITPEFNSLALQELQFSDNQVLRNVVFEDVALTEGGEGNVPRNVTFSLKGTIDPDFIRYDGTPTFIETPTAFVETDGGLAVDEREGVVLGDSVVQQDI